MSFADLQSLLPLLVLSATTVIVMLAIATHRCHILTVSLTLAGLVLSGASISLVTPRQVTPLLIIDSYALFYTGLILAATIVVTILAYGYFSKQDGPSEELYLLILIATTGSTVLVSASHFASLFLGLEILSVPLYALIGYKRLQKQPLEAAIKYLVLAAVSASFLLFGMALVYAELGTMQFDQMAKAVTRPEVNMTLLLPGFALIVAGFGFKLAVVPFHLWTPDVYQGAPAPVTAFVATVSKGAMVGLLLRYFSASAGHSYAPVFTIFTIVAIASMIAGNVLALLQDNVKRILAYSSIAHLGYILVAFQAAGQAGAEAVTFYLLAYFITTLGAFGIVSLLSTSAGDREQLEDYRGLFWRRPALAAIFTAMLFSLAGIPLTAGFMGKFYIVAAGASANMWALIITLVVTSAIGLYYYLRIVVALYSTEEHPAATRPLSRTSAATLAILTVLLIWLGVYPAPMLALIRSAVTAVNPGSAVPPDF